MGYWRNRSAPTDGAIRCPVEGGKEYDYIAVGGEPEDQN